MGTRGRKSGAALATVAKVALVERPQPALDLTPEQADIWVDITNSMPADWFTAENFPLLAQYCRHVVSARKVAQLIDLECAREEVDTKALTELLAAECKQSASLKALAASMRLAQQSRYGDGVANTAKKRAVTVKRPWES